MTDVTDAGLLDRARRGNEEAFAALFERYQRSIYRYASYMCGRDAADDIVQETFLVVLRQSSRRDELRTSLVAYLLGIARHLVMKRGVGAAVEVPTSGVNEEVAQIASSNESVLDEMTRGEAIEALRVAIDSLPAPYREVVVLCELQELDYSTAAAVLQVPIGTVRSRLHRARALLEAKVSVLQSASDIRGR
jgi:RNA polymerase sigma-70 factor, ECF subfamily